MAKTLLWVQENIRRETGAEMIALVTFTHPDMPTPLRFASPLDPLGSTFTSNGLDFIPTRIELTVGSERFDEPAGAVLSIDAVDGVVLEALQALDPSPSVDIQMVLFSEPDSIQAQLGPLLIQRVDVEGIRSMTIVLGSDDRDRVPFPGLAMTRQTLPAIFTDLVS